MNITLFNEFCYYIIAMTYLCFTDYNSDPVLKVTMGWFIIFIMVGNLIYPNGYYFVKQYIRDNRLKRLKEAA
jgi:hypothetical protein